MKKILALCLTVMLLLAMVPVIGASAEDAEVAVFSVDAVEGAAGEEVTVTISIAKNPTPLCNAVVKVGFDATVFEAVKITPLMFGGAATSIGPTTANPLRVTWSNPLANTTETGAIATITFKIKDDAPAGTYDLTVTSDQAEVFDTVFNDVPFTTENGSIKVICKHTNTSVVGAKDATCSEEGYTGDTVCACGETIEKGSTIEKLAHTEVVEGAVAPSCSAVGSTGTTKCDVCGEVIKEAEEIEKTAHTEVVEGAVDATCTEAGSTGTTKCDVCGEVIKEAEVIEALGHTEEIVNAKEATCDEAGYTGDKVCSVCEEVLEKGEVIDALGHDIKPVEAKDATCTEAGNIAHFACENCGATYADEEGAEAIDDVVIEALGHDYADGKCKVCGEEEKVEEDKPADTEDDKTESGDKDDTSPETGDVAGIVVVAMLMAIAAAAVVVLKKKA